MRAVSADEFYMQIVNIGLSGMEAAERALEKTAGQVAKGDDPAREMVDLVEIRNQFQVNARVVRTADEMEKTVVDMWG